MATIIQIKRSSGITCTTTLKLGELENILMERVHKFWRDRLFIGEGGVDGNGTQIILRNWRSIFF